MRPRFITPTRPITRRCTRPRALPFIRSTRPRKRSSAECSTRASSGSLQPSSTSPRSARWTRLASTRTCMTSRPWSRTRRRCANGSTQTATATFRIDINEFGAGDGVTPGIAAWGAEVAQYTQWALCTPALDVENVQPFWWGATPMADTDPWFSMVDSELSETPFGTAYLGEVQALTTQGCPIPPAATPPVGDAFGGDASGRAQPTQKRTVPPSPEGGKAVSRTEAARQRPRKAAARRNVRASLRQAALIRSSRQLSARAAVERIPVREARCDCAGPVCLPFRPRLRPRVAPLLRRGTPA